MDLLAKTIIMLPKIILISKWLPQNFKTNYILGINMGNHRVSPLQEQQKCEHINITPL